MSVLHFEPLFLKIAKILGRLELTVKFRCYMVSVIGYPFPLMQSCENEVLRYNLYVKHILIVKVIKTN